MKPSPTIIMMLRVTLPILFHLLARFRSTASKQEVRPSEGPHEPASILTGKGLYSQPAQLANLQILCPPKITACVLSFIVRY